MMWSLILWFACSAPGIGPVGPSDGPVVLRAWVDGPPRGAGGTLVVQADFEAGGAVQVPEPIADGLTFTVDGPAITEDLGDRQVVTQRYVFTGAKGSYEIPPMLASWSRDDTDIQAESRSIFVDLEVEGPGEGELADILEPPEVWSVPWAPLLGLGLLFVGGLAVAFRPRRVVEEADSGPPPPPDEVALSRWAGVRADPALLDDEKARLLALIFRKYVEDALGFPATAWTTTEIVSHLGSMSYLREGDVPRAKRLLRATDRVKFAEDRPGEDFFVDLDSDLRAFVASTRPGAWQVAVPEGAPVVPDRMEGEA